MRVTTQTEVVEDKSVFAREFGARGQYTLFEEQGCLGCLECRTRRVVSHYGTVEQRFALVFHQFLVVGSSVASGK